MTAMHWQGIFNLINFLIFVFVLVKFAGPAVKNILRQRQEETMTAIRSAEAAKRDAEEALTITKTRLANIEGDIARVVEDSRTLAANQAALIEQAAKEDAARIRASARFAIEAERQAAVAEIRKLVMAQAFDRASLELQQQMSPERQRELVGQLIQKVGDGSLAFKS